MTESEKIQKALDSGYTTEQIKSWYLAKGLQLPTELAPSAARSVGASAPLGVKAAMTAMQGPTLGFADELMGLITAPAFKAMRPDMPLSQAYQQVVTFIEVVFRV